MTSNNYFYKWPELNTHVENTPVWDVPMSNNNTANRNRPLQVMYNKYIVMILVRQRASLFLWDRPNLSYPNFFCPARKQPPQEVTLASKFEETSGSRPPPDVSICIPGGLAKTNAGMTGTNPPPSSAGVGGGGPTSAAAIARAGPGTQALKQSTQAAFEGIIIITLYAIDIWYKE